MTRIARMMSARRMRAGVDEDPRVSGFTVRVYRVERSRRTAVVSSAAFSPA